MFFRQGLALLVVALVAQNAVVNVDARYHHHSGRERMLHKQRATLRGEEDANAGTFRRSHHEATASHDYHTRYHLIKNDDAGKVNAFPIDKEGKVDQEFSIGSKGSFEQNIHIPASGKARDITLHYEKGTLDVVMKELEASSSSRGGKKHSGRQQKKQQRQKIHNHGDAIRANAEEEKVSRTNNAFVTQFQSNANPSAQSTERTIGFAVLACAIVGVAFTLIATIVYLVSGIKKNTSEETIVPQLEASDAEPATDSESEVEEEVESVTEPEAETEAKEPVVRENEAEESFEASV